MAQNRCLCSDEELVRLFNEGYSLREIGRMANITGERVRQRIKSHFHSGDRSAGFSKNTIAENIDASPDKVSRAIDRLGIRPKKFGGCNLYSASDVAMIKGALEDRRCRVCGAPLSGNRVSLCDECRNESARYSYPFLSPEGRLKWCHRVKNWREKNRDKWKAIAKRNYARFRISRMANSDYIVSRNNRYGIPVGTKLDVVDAAPGFLITSAGQKISVRIVRKVPKIAGNSPEIER